MSVIESAMVDSLGRRRQPGQSSGLKRPLPLPPDWQSRSVRMALPAADWQALESLAAFYAPGASSMSAALGAVVHQLLETHRRTEEFRWNPDDWMEWERRKTLRLLRLAV
jgi:hypothetical protein